MNEHSTAHEPTLCRTRRYGCWATCTCGWQSGMFTTVTGAHLDFGQHLTSVIPPGATA